ncbi:MAG TPA: D-2-hydroxyacid dehydrogenase [Actinokineospora sp.]|nr:D-2-hydroxyacid dehydrogenase [Actinokineospora sp.]
MDPNRRPTIVVLCGAERPPRMTSIEQIAAVRYTTGPRLAEAMPGADVLFAWDLRSTALRQAWPSADALRWIHAAAAGVSHLMVPGLAESEVVLTNARGIFDEPVAEYVLTVMLAFAKDLPTTLRLQQRRIWQHRETERLAGSRALIVGAGPIGRAIARKLRAAGVAVSGVGQQARSNDPDFGEVVPMAELRRALPEHDHVVVALPLTPATAGLIDANALRAMRPTARLITIGRRGLVVTADLLDALDHGLIAGAALEVFADEPLPPSSPLWDQPNVLLSPHMSGDVKGWRDELVRLFETNLARYVSGEPLLNVVETRRTPR